MSTRDPHATPPERDATPDEAFELGKTAGWDEGYRAAKAEGASVEPPSFVLAQAIMRIVREGGPYVEAAIENECAHALRKARES